MQPPPPRAHDPRLAWIDRRRLWRCWRFKTGTLRRLTARRRRLRGRHYEAPPRRLLLRLRGLLSAHTELYRGLFLLVLSCIGCVGRQHIKPLLSAPTPHPPQQSSHPGPKSRGSTSALNLQRYVLLLVIFLFLRTAQAGHGSADARVGGNPRQEPPEADQLGFRCFSSKANSNGVPQFSARHPKPVRKRAFMRAQRRAVLHGQAKCRGQWWSAQDLGCEAGPVRSMPQQPHAAPKPEPRIKFLSWNAGGLPSERNLELQAWLRSPEGHDVQIAVVQETHWRGPLEYRTDRFFAVHSGSTKSEAGLLVLVDKQAFAESTIQHREIIPGRLLHVRVETSPCLDLVVGYQHAWSLPRANVAATAAKDAVLAKRAEFWAQLTTLLSALPVRNRVLFLGDLNTTFGTEGSSVGRGILTRQGSHAPDTPVAQDMLRSLDLVVLNSWGPVGLRACTFVPACKRGHSQIDFAIMRKPEADALARCTAPKLLPFVPHTGMRHLPLLGSIPMPRKPITQAAPNPISRRKVQELCRIHPQLPDTFQLAVANIHASAPALSATELLTQAWQHATSSLPNQLPIQVQRTDYRPVLKLWRLRQTVRDLLPEARHSARVMFRLWQCRAALQAHQRELRRLCRANKRLKFDQMLQAAAATAPGLQRVHQVLRVFAPKAPRRKLQLRASNGMPLCIAETVEAISVYYTDLFGRTVLSCSLPAPTTPLQITTAEFQCALQGLPGNKALPPSVSPAALWTLAADTLAAKLLPQVNHWLRHMHLPPPDDWHIADICLLPKPNKPVAGPETLRPISLLHPVAKALAVVINARLRPQLQTLVQELPQFSYLEGRSVQDALDRAMAHCSHVRSILHAQHQNPHLKRQGHAPAACRGGVTLSLDLQQAFDLMPRDSLLSAMQLANLDYSIQYAVLQLHSHAHMRFAHGGCTATVRTTNGVRQGCGLAPSLWCLFTCLVLTHIQKEISSEATTVYADDFLFQWTVESPQHFEQIVAQIGYILRTLDSFGMRVSPTKTVLLVSLKGPLAGSTLRPHVRKLPGKGRHLRIPLQTEAVFQAQQFMLLPVVAQHTYLGAKLSYSSPEALTLKERMKLSWTAFGRLLPALRSAGLTLNQRVQLWQSCVLSSLLHSLDSAGLVPGGAQALRQHVIRQLRILSKAPSYITREPGEQLLARLKVEDPIAVLARKVGSRLQLCRGSPKALLQPQLVHKWWQQLESCFSVAAWDSPSRQHDTPLRAPARLVAITLDKDPEPCPVCGSYFPDTRTMRIHITQKHQVTYLKSSAGKRKQSQMRRDFMKHSVDGMPQCCHCGWAFTAWPSFCQHFERERCPVLHGPSTRHSNPTTQADASPDPVSVINDASGCTLSSNQKRDRSSPRSREHHAAGNVVAPDQPPNPCTVQASVRTPETPRKPSSVPTDPPVVDPFPAPADELVHVQEAVVSVVHPDLPCALHHVSSEMIEHARTQRWQALAALVKQGTLQHCLFCNQWLAHAGYLSRHIKAQHPEHYVHHDWVQRWLQTKPTSVLSPCQFCGTNYKVKHCSRPRHTQSCQVLYRTGFLLSLVRPNGRDGAHSDQPRSRSSSRDEPGPAHSGKPSQALAGHDAGQRGQQPPWPEPARSKPEHGGALHGQLSEPALRQGGGRRHGHHSAGQACGAGEPGPPLEPTGGAVSDGQRRQVSSPGEQGEHKGLWRWMVPRPPPKPGTAPTAMDLRRERHQGGEGCYGQEDPQPMHGPDQFGLETRRPDVDQSLPVELCDVLPVQRPAHGGPRVHQGHSGMEGGQGEAAGDDHLADASLSAEAVAGSPHQALRGLPGQRYFEGSGGGDARAGLQWHGPLLGVGPAGQGDESEEGSRADEAGASYGNVDQNAGSGPAAPGGDAFSCYPQAGMADEQRSCPDDAGDRGAHTRGQSFVGGLRPPLSQRSHPMRCHIAPPGQDGAVGFGHGSAEAIRRHVRTLRLRNPGNHCYANASVLSLCWLWSSGTTARAETFGPRLQHITRWLCAQTQPVMLWRNISWSTLHVGWNSPHIQHDVVEYLTFLRPFLGLSILSGSWQSRQRVERQCVELDAGCTWPLLLPAPLHTLATEPTGAVSLQSLIDEWTNSQAGLHGLSTEPLALLLQVNRFVPCPDGVHKVTVPVVPETYIHVPRFENSLEDADPLSLQYSRYCRVSSFLHFGERPSEGHYRAILYDTNIGALITDDDVAAAGLSQAEASAYHSQGYAFIYRLCPVSV